MKTEFSPKQLEAIKHIRNFIVHRGRTPSIRELMSALGYRSPRSAQDILEQLETKGIIKKMDKGDYQFLHDPEFGDPHVKTVHVPVIGMIACGTPLLAEQNIEGYNAKRCRKYI